MSQTSPPPPNPELGASLKAEGNALFGKKLYDEAIDKYNQAIDVDENNATLYANRAACYACLKLYGAAAVDARKATELESSYTKAWARLASAQFGLQDYTKAVDSWKRCISTLPNENLTALEQKQRDEYNALLKQALSQANLSSGSLARKGLAKEMVPWLQKKGITRSSAFVISEAYDSYQSALDDLNKVSQHSSGAIFGVTGVIAGISNAILQDERCITIGDSQFQQKMNIQFKMELTQSRSPRNLVDFDGFTTEIRRLHAQGGHAISRVAITTPMRLLICRAYMESGMSQDFAKAIDLYDYILRILRWGREEWPDVRVEDRGVIFEDTFVNGVRNLRLTAYMQAHSQNKNSSKFNLDDLLREADSLLEDARQHRPQRPELGFNLAFGDYIEANALAMKGYCWSRKTQATKFQTAEDVEQGIEQFKKSADLYFEASGKLPKDDENYAWYMKIGIDQLFSVGAPLFVTLPLLERLWRSVPLSQQIWQFSQMRIGAHRKLYEDLEKFHDQIRRQLQSGVIPNKNAGISPPWADPQQFFGKALDLIMAAPSQYIDL